MAAAMAVDIAKLRNKQDAAILSANEAGAVVSYLERPVERQKDASKVDALNKAMEIARLVEELKSNSDTHSHSWNVECCSLYGMPSCVQNAPQAGNVTPDVFHCTLSSVMLAVTAFMMITVVAVRISKDSGR